MINVRYNLHSVAREFGVDGGVKSTSSKSTDLEVEVI